MCVELSNEEIQTENKQPLSIFNRLCKIRVCESYYCTFCQVYEMYKSKKHDESLS